MKRGRKDRQAPRKSARQRVAHEAARLIAAHGDMDLQQAKRKAARLLGVDDEASLPDNAEIQQQLRDYQRLFRAGGQPRELRLRREAALQAMGFLASFQPRLVGSVLEGTADRHSPIALQVFSDEAEVFARFLLDAGLPVGTLTERRLRLDRETVGTFPGWNFTAEGLAYEVTVLPMTLLRQAPVEGADARPMARASAGALRRLLEAEDAGAGDAPGR